MFSPSATAARGVSMELNAYVQLLHLLPFLKVISVVGALPHMGTHPAPAPLSWHDIETISDHCQGCSESVFFHYVDPQDDIGMSIHWIGFLL